MPNFLEKGFSKRHGTWNGSSSKRSSSWKAAQHDSKDGSYNSDDFYNFNNNNNLNGSFNNHNHNNNSNVNASGELLHPADRSSVPIVRKSKKAWKRHVQAKREAKVVQKSAGHVDKIVAELTDGKPFLLSAPNQPIAKFHRSEIVVGNMLGRGVFARVYEIKDFDLHGEEEEEEYYEQQQQMLQQQQQQRYNFDLELVDEEGEDEEDKNSSTMTPILPRNLNVIAESASGEDDPSSSLLHEVGHQSSQQEQQQQQQQMIDDLIHSHGNAITDGGDTIDHSDNNQGSHGDHSSAEGTSSTAPPTSSPPPTPPLTPADHHADNMHPSLLVASTSSTSASTTATSAAASALPDAPFSNSVVRSNHHNNSILHHRPFDPFRESAASTVAAANRNSMLGDTKFRHLMSQSQMQRHDQSHLRLRARDLIRSGETKYALKHLTKTLLRNPKDFYLAAAALVIEAKYLSKLNHPNIVKVTGLAVSGGGTAMHNLMGNSSVNAASPPRGGRTFGASVAVDYARRQAEEEEDDENEDGGHFDSYFLISERLTDTLDRRIRQWKREEPIHKKLSELSSDQKIATWKQMMRKTSYALQLSNALGYLHERKLIFRDLKPQNIGFTGDNQTICIFNFGLCRELDPVTGTACEDDVTAMYGAQSWKYTAVECFPQPITHSPVDFLAQSTNFLSHASSRSIGLESLSLSGSLRGLAKGRKRGKIDDHTLKELERELQQVHDKLTDGHAGTNSEPSSVASSQPLLVDATPHMVANGRRRRSNLDDRFFHPPYNEKVDVYSWAMVYYEMLTLSPPFSGMTPKQHLRKVAGQKGGFRPGVYQFDLTPSMISLLQRAWDQDPSKRPAIESVGRNLQLILRELEALIKDEQKSMIKSSTGGWEGALALNNDRAAKRAKKKEEKLRRTMERQQKKERSQSGIGTRLGAVVRGGAKFSSLFAGHHNQYRHGDVAESALPPASGVISADLSAPTPGSAAASTPPQKSGARESEISKSEIDLAALEYEVWSDDEDSSSVSASRSEGDSHSASSLTEYLADNEVVIIPPVPEETVAPTPPGWDKDDHSAGAESDDEGHSEVGDAISALRGRKKDGRAATIRSERDANGSHAGTARGAPGAGARTRRKTKAESMKSRRNLNILSSLSMKRRSTSRMSRRTMRLSKVSVWMMRRDVQVFLVLFSIVLSIWTGRSTLAWYKWRQAQWIGIDLDELGYEYSDNNSQAIREVLYNAMTEHCRYEDPPSFDPSVPMLFQGGATSPVDLDCMESLQEVLEDKVARVTGSDRNKKNENQCGFLNIKLFEAPPRRKKRKWRRKKTWKFFESKNTDYEISSESAPPSTSMKSDDSVAVDRDDPDAVATNLNQEKLDSRNGVVTSNDEQGAEEVTERKQHTTTTTVAVAPTMATASAMISSVLAPIIATEPSVADHAGGNDDTNSGKGN